MSPKTVLGALRATRLCLTSRSVVGAFHDTIKSLFASVSKSPTGSDVFQSFLAVYEARVLSLQSCISGVLHYLDEAVDVIVKDSDGHVEALASLDVALVIFNGTLARLES